MDENIRRRLQELYIPPISEFDEGLQVVWFIPREIIKKKTKNNKDYYLLRVVDSNSEVTTIKCWGVRPGRDVIHINRPYMAKLDYDPQWGFSSRRIRSEFKLLA